MHIVPLTLVYLHFQLRKLKNTQEKQTKHLFSLWFCITKYEQEETTTKKSNKVQIDLTNTKKQKKNEKYKTEKILLVCKNNVS